jgi:hypothetical protein
MPVVSPADDNRVVGVVSEAQLPQIDQAFKLARAAQPAWDQAGGAARAKVLRAMADALEANIDRLIAILSREAGKTLSDAIAEVREAVDFCRYYAVLAEDQFGAGEVLKGPVGETNTLQPGRSRRVRLHQPVELPAGHLHRPDRRRPGGRQRRAGQAGRADPADRLRGREALSRRRPGPAPAGPAARSRRDGRRGADRS